MGASSGPDYRLGADEVILLNDDRVRYGQKLLSGERFEAVLTNQRFMVFSTPALFGSSKQLVDVGLSQIKVFNDQAQVFLSNRVDVDVHHAGGSERLRFESKAAAARWIETINLLATGRADEVVIDDGVGRGLPGAEQLSEAFGETLGAFKGMFGKKSPAPARRPAPAKTAESCQHCGGPLQGYVGKVVTCAHCGRPQQLGGPLAGAPASASTSTPASVSAPPAPSWASTSAPVPGPPPGSVPAPIAEASWKPDPVGRHEFRWWDGTTWTALVADHGVTGNDPL